jgi:hypothetical protein
VTVDNLTAADVARLRRVADRDEIRQLAYRYAWALDTRDLDAAADLFVPDLRDRVRDQFETSMRGVGVTILFVGNHLVDFDADDEARGLVYCRGYIETRDGSEPGRNIEQAILYRDRYRRADGAWRFVGRKHELWYGVETAERPLHQRAAEWPRHHDGVGTVPYGEPTWQAFWARHGGETQPS